MHALPPRPTAAPPSARPPLGRATSPLVAALAILATACASTPEGAAAGEEPAAPGSEEARSRACQGNCSLQVDNRPAVDVRISTRRPRGTRGLGVVPAHSREVFELPDFEGRELEVWAREAWSGDYVAVKCVRQFLTGVGRVVIDPTMSRGPCTQRSPTRDG